MAKVEQITVTLPAAALLGAVWYSDGSGAVGGLGIETLSPNDYEVAMICLEGDDDGNCTGNVYMELRIKEEG